VTENPETQVLVGIDLGGTKIEGVVIEADRPDTALARLRVPTEREQGYDHILGRICGLIDTLSGAHPEAARVAVGIATPGTWDPLTQTLRGSNTQCLNGKPLRSDLANRLGRAVSIENDANCFVMAEATLGSARGYETVFGIILGTGCGGAFVANGRLLRGRHGIAGEWGQLVVEPGGDVSPHGTLGTLETYIAGPALEDFYAHESGSRRSLIEIADRADEDPAAGLTMERLAHYFTQGLAAVVDVLDPHAIVIGGGVGNCALLYSDTLRRRLSSAIFAPSFEAAILRPTLGDSAGVFGAALLTRDGTGYANNRD
jgi:predicted NBD/HSP70 family sugar kinase